MIKEFAVASPQDQRLTIYATTTRPDHLGFVYRHFNDKADSSLYVAMLGQLPPDQPADYFRWLTLVAAQEAQFGSDHLKEPIQRHAEERNRFLYFGPRHQLARACRLGSLNVQAYYIKSDIVERLGRWDPENAAKIWQVALTVEGDKVLDSRIKRPMDDLRIIMKDHPTRDPICLTDVELNRRLAAFNFTSRDAETVSLGTFTKEVVPAFQAVVGNLLNVEKAVEGFRSV